MKPAYLKTRESGELAKRVKAALEELKDCHACPRGCGVNRTAGELGICKTGRHAQVSSFNLHFGEEDPLVGEGGSGTIFFSRCNLLCIFCQNFDISHEPADCAEVGPDQLAKMMIQLQKNGAENINFVTPSHVVPQILEALPIAIDNGLDVPLVYNTSSYDRLETIRWLDGIFDIYLPDLKFADSKAAKRLAKAEDYPKRAEEAVKEMHRQVGDLVTDERGVAVRGVMVRHLVMPEGLAGTEYWMRFLSEEVSKNTYVNIMDQYRPCGLASKYPEINRPITPEEYARAVETAGKYGITRLDERRKNLVYRLWQALR